MNNKTDFKTKYLWKPWREDSFELYEREEQRLNELLSGLNFNIYFIGSSSVKGLGGKGYIDIYISTDDLDKINSKLIEAGYEFKPNGGDEHRLFFLRYFNVGEERLAYHVHAGLFNSNNLIETIAFRDYLRLKPGDANKYSEIKKLASEEAAKQIDKKRAREVYLSVKGPVIEDIMSSVRKYIKENPERYGYL